MTRLTGHIRRRYTPAHTALEPMERLSEHLGGPRLWVKRDDLTGLACGGNKTRKLEFLVADALDRGADTLITCGSVQSNHCRLTAAAAAREGLACHLVLREKRPGQYDPEANGNNLLYRLLGPSVHVHPPGTDLDLEMRRLATQLADIDRTPYVIPMGGSNALGSLGYVACAEEIRDQAHHLGIRPDAVVCASSSGGTQAGLVLGFADTDVPVLGISVDWSQTDQEAEVRRIVALAAAACGEDPPAPERVVVDDRWVGPGYAQPTDEMVEAVRLFARFEGLILDPVYTGKAAAGLIGRIREGAWGPDADVVFVHTGGSPALFEYRHPAVP